MQAIVKKWGNSLGFRINAAMAAQANIQENQPVNISVVDGGLVVRPARKKYKLDDLLAQCDFKAPASKEMQEWLDDSPMGNEVI